MGPLQILDRSEEFMCQNMKNCRNYGLRQAENEFFANISPYEHLTAYVA